MSLRVKVELALFLVVGSVVGLTYTIQRFVVLPDLNPYEEKVAQKDMLESIDALRSEVSRLNTFCVDWSRGVDIINYVREAGRDDAVVDITLDDLAKSSLSLVFVLDDDGNVVWGKVIDSGSRQEIELAEFPKDRWDRSHPLLNRMASGVSIRGVMLTEAGPMLVSSNPITDPMTMTSSGSLVLGRRLDERFLSSIFENTSFAFRVWPVTDPSLPEEEAKIIEEITHRGLSHVTHVSDDMFRVYAVFPDIHGKPALMLRSDVNRNVLAKAYEAMQLGLLIQVGVALAALVVLIVLFRRSVMNSLTELTNHVIRIGKTNDLSARLNFKRDDELGVLATEFDRMVAQLEEDLDRRTRIEEALRESEERYALAVKGANDGLWDWNLSTDEIHFSERWKSMLGYEEHEIEDLPEEWLGRVHPEDRENVVMALDVHVKGQSTHFESEHRIRHKGDNYLWVLCRGIAVREDGVPATRMAGSMSDITLRKLFEEQLSHQALHDSLTALPNRALFLDRLSQAMKQLGRDGKGMFAVLFLDLDRFKVINDGLGHVIGDTLLAAFAAEPQKSVRPKPSGASDPTLRMSRRRTPSQRRLGLIRLVMMAPFKNRGMVLMVGEEFV
ncbi:MAG: diguanylate cyclase [Candidatus Hydrogenedentes bacterium]|nr:diguanylate cyclase [Candidatus Hydrogenedentota bacterium]